MNAPDRMNALKIGTVVRMGFDGRGLAEVTDTEDGMYEIRYLPDPARTSEHMKAGETEWAVRADLEVAA